MTSMGLDLVSLESMTGGLGGGNVFGVSMRGRVPRRECDPYQNAWGISI